MQHKLVFAQRLRCLSSYFESVPTERRGRHCRPSCILRKCALRKFKSTLAPCTAFGTLLSEKRLQLIGSKSFRLNAAAPASKLYQLRGQIFLSQHAAAVSRHAFTNRFTYVSSVCASPFNLSAVMYAKHLCGSWL